MEMNNIQKVTENLKKELETNYKKTSCKNLCDINVFDTLCMRVTKVYTEKTIKKYTEM